MRRQFMIVLCLVAFGFVLAACHNRPTSDSRGFTGNGFGADAGSGSSTGSGSTTEFGNGTEAQPQSTPCDDADGDGVCDKDEAEPSAIVFEITSPSYDGQAPVVTSAASVDLQGSCSEGIGEIAVEVGPKVAGSRIEVDAGGCTGEKGTWSAKGIVIGAGTTMLTATAIDDPSGETLTRVLPVQRVAGLDPDYIPADMNIDTARCGDGMCNLRVEDHWSCPKDCNGKYYVVDLNNKSCSDYSCRDTKAGTVRTVALAEEKPEQSACTSGEEVQKGAGTVEKPFCHIAAVAELVEPGDTVYLRNGMQDFGWALLPKAVFRTLVDGMFAKGGSAEKGYVTFRHFPGERPVVDTSVKLATGWTKEAGMSGASCGNGKTYTVYSRSFRHETWLPAMMQEFYAFFYKLRNPLSPLFRKEDLVAPATLALPAGRNESNEDCVTHPVKEGPPFDAYVVDFDFDNGMKDQKLYVRLCDSGESQPEIYEGFGYNQQSKWFNIPPYVRFIGLTFQHNSAGVMLWNNIVAGRVVEPEHVEFYDNVFQSLIMGISELSYLGREMHGIIHNNRFLGIGRSVMPILETPYWNKCGDRDICNVGDVKNWQKQKACLDNKTPAERDPTWQRSEPYNENPYPGYRSNGLDHALYGKYPGWTFSGNEVDGSRTSHVMGITGGAWYDNIIRGGMYSRSGQNISWRFFNNAVVTSPYDRREVMLHDIMSAATSKDYLNHNNFFKTTGGARLQMQCLMREGCEARDYVFKSNVFLNTGFTRLESPQDIVEILNKFSCPGVEGYLNFKRSRVSDNNLLLNCQAWGGYFKWGCRYPDKDCRDDRLYFFDFEKLKEDQVLSVEANSVNIPLADLSAAGLLDDLEGLAVSLLNGDMSLLKASFPDKLKDKELCWDKPRPANKDMAARSDCVGPYKQGLGPYRVAGTPATDEFDRGN